MAGAWPGAQMTSAGTNDFGENIYSVDIPAGATKVIFTNGTAQTVDITLSGEEGYYTDGTQTDGKFNALTWSSGSTGGGGDIGGGDIGGSGTTVKFTDNQKWGTVYAYFFSDSQIDMAGAWPGTPMTFLETNGYGENVYTVDIPAGATKVIFSNGTAQTVDIDLTGAEGFYTDGSQTEGKFNALPWA